MSELLKLAKEKHIETDTTKRWEEGLDHDPRSVNLMEFLRKLDAENGYCFDWRFGGDGDNGEEMLYQLDVWFETMDLA